MKKRCSFALAVIFSAQTLASDWQKYHDVAVNVVEQSESLAWEKIQEDSETLVVLAKTMLVAFVAKNPACADYVNAALSQTSTMLSASLEEIERDFHADGKLPPMKKLECYHAKDLLVHPATAVVITKTLDASNRSRKMVKHELVEVIEHFNQVRDASSN